MFERLRIDSLHRRHTERLKPRAVLASKDAKLVAIVIHLQEYRRFAIPFQGRSRVPTRELGQIHC